MLSSLASYLFGSPATSESVSQEANPAQKPVGSEEPLGLAIEKYLADTAWRAKEGRNGGAGKCVNAQTSEQLIGERKR